MPFVSLWIRCPFVFECPPWKKCMTTAAFHTFFRKLSFLNRLVKMYYQLDGGRGHSIECKLTPETQSKKHTTSRISQGYFLYRVWRSFCFELRCRQNHTQTGADERFTPATVVGVSNYIVDCYVTWRVPCFKNGNTSATSPEWRNMLFLCTRRRVIYRQGVLIQVTRMHRWLTCTRSRTQWRLAERRGSSVTR